MEVDAKTGASSQPKDDLIFWRLIVQPSLNLKMNLQDQTNLNVKVEFTSEVQVLKEISWWKKVPHPSNDKNPYHWKNKNRKVVQLEDVISKGVRVVNGYIEFDGEGSYIKVGDRGLKEEFRGWGVQLLNVDLSGSPIKERTMLRPENLPSEQGVQNEIITSKLSGKNIQIEAEIEVSNNGRCNPVFYVKQPAREEYVCLSVNSKKNLYQSEEMYQIVWEISGQCYETYPYEVNGQHLINISQDRDRDPENNEPTYFEIFIDSLQYKIDEKTQKSKIKRKDEKFVPGITVPTHIFSNKPLTYYIGYNPRTKKSFQGKLRRLVFDPNASCIDCP